MNCKHCDGTGKSNMYKDGEFVDCMYCGGTGEIEVEMTNKEWLQTCSTEELAGAIYEWYSAGYTTGRVGLPLNSITVIVEWLKQPHQEKE